MTSRLQREIDREQQFERVFSEYDEKQLTKVLSFKDHRFITLERDKVSSNYYVRGHENLRGACAYLQRAIEEGEPYVPERIFDLDTSETHELDLFAFVAPRSFDAVAVMLPRTAAEAALAATNASNASGDMAVARRLLKQAIDRR